MGLFEDLRAWSHGKPEVVSLVKPRKRVELVATRGGITAKSRWWIGIVPCDLVIYERPHVLSW